MDLFDFIDLSKSALFDKGDGSAAASNEGEAAPSGDAGSGSESSPASSGAEGGSGSGSGDSAVPSSAPSEPTAEPASPTQSELSSDFVMPEFSGEDLDEIEIPADAGASGAEDTPPAQLDEAGTSDTADDKTSAEEGAEVSSEEDGQKATSEEEKKGEGEAEAGPQKSESEEAGSEAPASGEQPPSSMEPGQLAQQIQEHRDSMIQGLAENHFALSDSEVEEIETDPRSAIPKLLARTYVDSLSTMLTRMSESVPRMVQTQAAVMQRNMQAEQQFFEQFPHIPKDQRSVVAQVAKGYRASFPDASLDEVMRATGEIVTQRLGLTPQNAPQNGAGSNQQQNASQKANPDGKPRSTKSPPFQPATAGPSAPAQPPVIEDPWAGLGLDHEDEG